MNSIISWFQSFFSSSGSENVHVEQNIEEHIVDNIGNDDIEMDEQDPQGLQDLEDRRWLYIDLSILEDRDSLDLKGETLSSEEKYFIGRLANESVTMKFKGSLIKESRRLRNMPVLKGVLLLKLCDILFMCCHLTSISDNKSMMYII